MIISRRIIRIKVLQSIYSHLISGRSLQASENELWKSIKRSYDQFFYLLDLLIALLKQEEENIEIAGNKQIPTYEDLHPNTKFIDNKVINQLANNKQIRTYKQKHKIHWTEAKDFIKNILDQLKTSDVYHAYMNDPEQTYQKDKQFVISVLSEIIGETDSVYEQLEDMDILWNPETEYTVNIIIGAIKKLNASHDENHELLNLKEDPDDAEFAKHLFRKSIINQEIYDDLISKYIENWEIERIAFIDRIVLHMALNEVVECPLIPVKVSFDEYLDIVKLYSTKNSNNFVNGVLDKSVKELRENNKVNKQGRGLIGEV